MVKRIFLDNGLLSTLCEDRTGIFWNSFLDTTNSIGHPLENRRNIFMTDTLLFLEFIGLGKILEKVPTTLSSIIKENTYRFFNQKKTAIPQEINNFLDIKFEQCLKICLSLPEITPQSLISQHKGHLNYLNSRGVKFLDSLISSFYLELLNNMPEKMHISISRDLAWHLLTTILRTVFNEISTKKHPELVLKFFEPLMAMIHHAVTESGTQPNFFRVAEAAYLSTIRQTEKKLNPIEQAWIQDYRKKHKTGKKDDLCDCIYLDKALLGYLKIENGELIQVPITVLTMDNPIEVFNRLKLFRNVLEKLRCEVDNWNLNPVYSCEVICFEKTNDLITYKDTVKHAVHL